MQVTWQVAIPLIISAGIVGYMLKNTTTDQKQFLFLMVIVAAITTYFIHGTIGLYTHLQSFSPKSWYTVMAMMPTIYILNYIPIYFGLAVFIAYKKGDYKPKKINEFGLIRTFWIGTCISLLATLIGRVAYNGSVMEIEKTLIAFLIGLGIALFLGIIGCRNELKLSPPAS